MAPEIEFDPPDAIAVGTVGEPGHRAFYLQARSALRSLTMAIEKTQVRAMAERTIELLQGRETGPEEEPVDLAEPVSPDWRVAQVGIGLDPDRDRVVIVAQEMPAAEDTDPDSLAMVRVWARPAQMLALAGRALELCNAGRPLCAMCGFPIDPEGHLCPRKNGKSPIFN
jgi:uncharacterized repeat protein (TIGR03847 family)